ncbi:MAG TPA: SDR family oxidoreductase [Dongiaceae bacterium]|nr:SDR family oxidoreductase [Dongiaceae bacterium]
MRIFVTGATGFIGTEVVQQLLAAGHQVLGLARSDAAAQTLAAAGVAVHRGSLEDPASLRAGAAAADGVIHLGFIHDFSNFLENCEIDRRAIAAMGAALVGSARPLIVTSGTGMGNLVPGQPATEDNFNAAHPNPRAASELAANALLSQGVKVVVVRLPQVHDTLKQGLITYAITLAREKGVSAYIDAGENRWPSAHVRDVARLYRLALEKAEAGARYHAVAEEGVTMRAIAEAIGHGLKVPVKSIPAAAAAAHFGWLGMFAGYDMPASSALTRKRLGWQPTGPGLIADLEQMRY